MLKAQSKGSNLHFQIHHLPNKTRNVAGSFVEPVGHDWSRYGKEAILLPIKLSKRKMRIIRGCHLPDHLADTLHGCFWRVGLVQTVVLPLSRTLYAHPATLHRVSGIVAKVASVKLQNQCSGNYCHTQCHCDWLTNPSSMVRSSRVCMKFLFRPLAARLPLLLAFAAFESTYPSGGGG